MQTNNDSQNSKPKIKKVSFNLPSYSGNDDYLRSLDAERRKYLSSGRRMSLPAIPTHSSHITSDVESNHDVQDMKEKVTHNIVQYIKINPNIQYTRKRVMVSAEEVDLHNLPINKDHAQRRSSLPTNSALSVDPNGNCINEEATHSTQRRASLPINQNNQNNQNNQIIDAIIRFSKDVDGQYIYFGPPHSVRIIQTENIVLNIRDNSKRRASLPANALLKGHKSNLAAIDETPELTDENIASGSNDNMMTVEDAEANNTIAMSSTTERQDNEIKSDDLASMYDYVEYVNPTMDHDIKEESKSSFTSVLARVCCIPLFRSTTVQQEEEVNQMTRL